jgi:hypothetical protein
VITPAAVGSTILSTVTSAMIGNGIGVQASFLRGSASAGQTTNLTVGSSVVFNQVDASSGSDISLNTTTSVITLVANRAYRLIGCVPNIKGGGGGISVQWSNITSGSLVGSAQSYYSPTNGAAYAASGSEAEYIFTPSVTTTVAFTITTNSGVTQLGGNTDFSLAGSYPWFEVQVIGSWAPYIAPSLVNFVSSLSLTSSLQGLGSMGYLSSITISSIISTPQLTSSLQGLGSMGYLSSVPSTFISSATLLSSIQALGSLGYISSAQLTSTAQGLTSYINSFIDPQELASSITGLGSLQFISSIGLLSTSQGLANYITSFIDPQELASTVTGLGSAQYISTTVTATNAIFTSSLVGLGSMGYLSSIVLSSIISTPQLTSSLVGLGSMGYLSSLALSSIISTPQLTS